MFFKPAARVILVTPMRRIKVRMSMSTKCNSMLPPLVKHGFRAMPAPFRNNGEMASELWQRLRIARAHTKLTQAQIGDACGVTREAVSQWEAKDPDKRRNPGVPRLRVYERMTGAPLSWLLDDNANLEPETWGAVLSEPDPPGLMHSPDYIEIPVVHPRPGAVGEHHNGNGSILFRPRSLQRHGIPHDRAEAHYVSDDGMAPRICEGDTVVIDTTLSPIQDGRIYVIEWAGTELVRRLYHEHDDMIRIAADNQAPAYRDRVVARDAYALIVLGKVRWVGSWEG